MKQEGIQEGKATRSMLILILILFVITKNLDIKK